MPEFLHLVEPNDALNMLLAELPNSLPKGDTIETPRALGRYLLNEICAPHPLPEFIRSTVDGYAVRAGDTHGATETMPAYLHLMGEVAMGEKPDFVLQPGCCALIHTGGMLPEGSNAVVMLEYTQRVQIGRESPGKEYKNGDQEIEITRSIAEGENLLSVGEDVINGQVILPAGTRIRPEEIGGCMALGITRLDVISKPIISIISSGDEVVPPRQKPKPGQVRDINSYSLAALVEQAGGKANQLGIVGDDLEKMRLTARMALQESDMLIITAGSSASARDITVQAIASLGEPGVLVHGINIKPGKPTILAVCNGKAVIGLPGNPVSALVIARLFILPVINKLMGVKSKIQKTIFAQLTINIPSQTGREDYIPIRLIAMQDENDRGNPVCMRAEPVFGKSNLIFSLAVADGLLRIPASQTGFHAGDIAEIILIE